MYEVNDWRTDNWAGHKPVAWSDGSNLKFPRTMREAGISFDFNTEPEEVSHAFQNYAVMLVIGVLLGMAVVSDVAQFIEHVIDLYHQCVGLLK